MTAELLGAVVEAAARRCGTPFAFPLMDLTLEKLDLLQFLGVADTEAGVFHFSEAPSLKVVSEVVAASRRPFPLRIEANQDAIRYIAERAGLLPVGMLIGPFSLMTKLVADPIVPVAMAGSGVTAPRPVGVFGGALPCARGGYPEVAAAAIAEMRRQVGDLTIGENGVALRGLMIRHLVLPNNIAGTDQFVRIVAEKLARSTFVNLMSQYRPEHEAFQRPELCRRVTCQEYARAVNWAREAGLASAGLET